MRALLAKGWLALVLLVAMPLASCSETSEPQWDLPVHYRIKVVAPRHYDIWVDTFLIESLSRDIGWRAPVGSVSCCWKAPHGATAEWQAMPELFLIRWFSFAEQQSYRALIPIEDPQKLFKEMNEPAPIMRNGKQVTMPRDTLVLGLAPGGQVVMWIMNWEETAVEVGRYQAKPYNYKEKGEDYTRRTKSYLDRQGQYLEKNGIPYDSW